VAVVPCFVVPSHEVDGMGDDVFFRVRLRHRQQTRQEAIMRLLEQYVFERRTSMAETNGARNATFSFEISPAGDTSYE